MKLVHLLTSMLLVSAMSVLSTSSWGNDSYSQDVTNPDGTWRGRSSCVSKASGCHDEDVVYRITHEKGSDNYNVDADKIVNGQVINMGPLVFSYDKAKGVLFNKTGKNNWQITVQGNQMEGVLLRDGEVFRKIVLTKDK